MPDLKKFVSIEIDEAGGDGTNAKTYTGFYTESLSDELGEVEGVTFDDGNLVPMQRSVDFSVIFGDGSQIITDWGSSAPTHVLYHDSTYPPDKAKVTLKGVNGGRDVTYDSVTLSYEDGVDYTEGNINVFGDRVSFSKVGTPNGLRTTTRVV